jgi:site-specific DNA-methyltransferase (adenine-specific)
VNELERKYSKKTEEIDNHALIVSTRGSNDGIYDWFPMVQRFTRSFLCKIFEDKRVNESKVILDPFMGSGNTLVACREFGKIGYGVDVSPLFWFITHVKISNYSSNDFSKAISAIEYAKERWENNEIPALSSFRRLFSRRQLCKLFTFKKIADNLDSKAKELLLFALVSELIRFSKATRYGKGLRKKQTKKSLNIEKTLRAKLKKMQKDYELSSRNKAFQHTRLQPLLGDARNLSDVVNPLLGEREPLADGQVDCIITSPPYCNSADYIEMYKLEHWFIGCIRSYEEFRRLSYATIRSHTTFDNKSAKWKHPVIDAICDYLENSELLWNRNIVTMIPAYFDDLHSSLKELKRVLRPCGVIYLLVANSSYGATPIPTDLLLAEASESIGFDVETIKKVRFLTTSGQQWRIMDGQSKKLLRESLLVLKA